MWNCGIFSSEHFSTSTDKKKKMTKYETTKLQKSEGSIMYNFYMKHKTFDPSYKIGREQSIYIDTSTNCHYLALRSKQPSLSETADIYLFFFHLHNPYKHKLLFCLLFEKGGKTCKFTIKQIIYKNETTIAISSWWEQPKRHRQGVYPGTGKYLFTEYNYTYTLL